MVEGRGWRMRKMIVFQHFEKFNADGCPWWIELFQSNLQIKWSSSGTMLKFEILFWRRWNKIQLIFLIFLSTFVECLPFTCIWNRLKPNETKERDVRFSHLIQLLVTNISSFFLESYSQSLINKHERWSSDYPSNKTRQCFVGWMVFFLKPAWVNTNLFSCSHAVWFSWKD